MEEKHNKTTKSAEEHGPELLDHASYEELLGKLEQAEQNARQHWERILRMEADKENIARRAERDLTNAHKYALEKFCIELLPIIDSLELCETSVPAEMQDAAASVIQGVNLTLKMFYTVLEKFGVGIVNPLNSSFDSEHQQAISVQEDKTVPAGTVLAVLQKGYTLNGRLLRPALVVVSKSDT